jgi:hypothetical protein
MKRGALLVLLALSPAAAQAQTQPAPTQPQAQPGHMSISVRSGVATRRASYVMRGQRVVVAGRGTGQLATVEVVRKGRVIRRYGVPIGGGRFTASFVARRRGLLRIVARNETARARSKRVRVVYWRAGQGARGARVLLLQRTLRSLGFATPVTGFYDGGTSRGVLAYRKTNGMGKTGYASPAVYAKVLRRRGAFRLRFPNAGRRHVEFDWSRQVLVLARGRRPYRVYHASSGTASTPTVFGRFRFYSKQPGTNARGMLHSNYFIGGYAIHGYPSVPTYPASHGCIRIPNPNAAQVNREISLGERIYVYR